MPEYLSQAGKDGAVIGMTQGVDDPETLLNLILDVYSLGKSLSFKD
jgi:hypothetical protein